MNNYTNSLLPWIYFTDHELDNTFAANIRIHSPKKAIIHQVTTMLTTSKNALFPGHNHQLTTITDDLTFDLSSEHKRVNGYQYQW